MACSLPRRTEWRRRGGVRALRAAAAVLLITTAAACPSLGDEPPVGGQAEAGFRPQFKPTLHVTAAQGPIKIDGDLDDEGWKTAARATGFAEVQPGDQIRPLVASEAWVTYDSSHLYLALVARDDPRTIRASLRERDNIFSDDYFGLMLDTYGDASCVRAITSTSSPTSSDIKTEPCRGTPSGPPCPARAFTTRARTARPRSTCATG